MPATSDGNPNQLSPPTDGRGLGVVRMRRTPLALAILAGALLFGVLVYSIHRDRQGRDDATRAVQVQPEQPLLPADGGAGLAPQQLDQPAPTPEPDQEPAPKPFIKVVPVSTKKDPAAEARRREAEKIRRARMDAQRAALGAPLKAIKTSGDSRDAQAQGQAQGQGQSRAQRAPARSPSALQATQSQQTQPFAEDRDKEAFFDRAAATQWALGHVRERGHPLSLKTGGVIPALMVTGVNSDLPGVIIAQVSRHVYDTATGRHLLIPRGAKLYGAYDSRIVYGQSRVLVAWNRIIFPDGSAITLGAMPGADQAGQAGFEDQVDTHFWRTFGSAVLMSLISGVSAYAVDEFGQDDDAETPTVIDQLGAGLASQLGQTTATLLEKNLAIKPTLEIRPGYPFNIVVTKDIAFEEPYAPW